MAKPALRRKHIPQRTCVGCRQVMPKRSLIRIVRSGDKILIDHAGKLAGRGAYLHDRKSCWETGIKIALSRALKTSLMDEDKERLLAYAATLPEMEDTT